MGPSISSPPPVQIAPIQPEPDIDELARKRKALNERRRGGKSLRIETDLASSKPSPTGLSIPT